MSWKSRPLSAKCVSWRRISASGSSVPAPEVAAARTRRTGRTAAGSGARSRARDRSSSATTAVIAPPSTVGSWPQTTHSTPDTTPMPMRIPPPTVKSVPQPASGPSSRNGASAVEQELDALADEELAALAVPGHAPLAAARAGQRELRLDLGEERQHVLPVPAEALGARVDARSNDVHVGARDDDSPACRRQSGGVATDRSSLRLGSPTRASAMRYRTHAAYLVCAGLTGSES